MESINNTESIRETGARQHPETSKEYSKRYYKENKDKHLAYCNEKLHCEHCDSDYTRCRKKQHHNSAKHIKNVRMITIEGQLKKMMEDLVKEK